MGNSNIYNSQNLKRTTVDKEAQLFYLTHGNPYGDTIAEIYKYKDGYLLKAFSLEEACLSFDFISEADGLELINHIDDIDKAFGGCGGEEIYHSGKYSREKEYTSLEAITNAIVDDDAVFHFMEKVEALITRQSFVRFMENNIPNINEDLEFIYDDNLSLKKLCKRYNDYYKNF